MRPGTEEPRTIVELVKQLRDEMQYLLRREFDLARAEATAAGKQAGLNATHLAIGAAIGVIALFVLAQAVSIAVAALLALVMPLGIAVWLGPLIVAIVMAALAYMFVRTGLARFKRQSVVPEQTVDSLQESKQWLQEKVT